MDRFNSLYVAQYGNALFIGYCEESPCFIVVETLNEVPLDETIAEKMSFWGKSEIVLNSDEEVVTITAHEMYYKWYIEHINQIKPGLPQKICVY